jgi:hypothetical protein
MIIPFFVLFSFREKSFLAFTFLSDLDLALKFCFSSFKPKDVLRFLFLRLIGFLY